MAKPKIRHLALFARDPAALAKYYEKVFEMKVVHRSPSGENFFMSDGYMTFAILKHRLTGSAPVGLNHFGFAVDSRAEIESRIAEFGLEEPKKRPDDRPYAEYRACDLEGNFFDISQHGFEAVETEDDRAKKKELA